MLRLIQFAERSCQSFSFESTFISILAVLENACMQQSFPDSLDWAKLKDAHFNARQHEHFLNILLVGTMIGS